MLDTRLSARIKALREEQNLTAQALAGRLGQSVQHVYGMEGSYGSKPSLDTLEALAHVFQVDECDLFVFPGEGIRHDIREELRRIPNIDAAKLSALRDLMEEAVRCDLETVEKALDVMKAERKVYRRKAKR